MAEPIDWREVRRLQARIARLNREHEEAFARRRELILAMDQTMSRRAIGEVWGISNVAVTYTINGKPR